MSTSNADVQAPALDEARVISMGQIPAKARILHH
jgi:hypothetical protein